MKEFYTPPNLHITCFAPREHLSVDRIQYSMEYMMDLTNAAGNGASRQPGDIPIPIRPQT